MEQHDRLLHAPEQPVMDSSVKPEAENPRTNANKLSQLLFFWTIPMMWYGMKKGLNTDCLTKCLTKDNSKQLSDLLENKWNEEVNRAKCKRRQPKLRNALFRTFSTYVIFDGFLVFMFVLNKSLQPFVLAQLLIQYQQSNVTTLKSTLHNENLNRSVRSSTFTNFNLIYDNTLSSSFNGTLSKTNNHLPSIDNLMIDDNNIHLNKTENDDGVTKVVAPRLNYKEEKSDRIYEFNYLNTNRQEFNQFFSNLWNNTYFLASLVCTMTLFGCLFAHHTDLRQRMVGARMRIASCSLIYRKTLRLSKKSASQTAGGYLVNLLSNDVGRLDYGFIYAHHIWVLPFQSCLICYLIWREIGYAAFVGVIGLLLKTIPVQTGLSRLASKLRLKVAIRTDKRVSIMNEIIQGIQVIKMYAWEKPFHVVVAEARRNEIQQIRYASWIRGINLCTMVFTERSTLFLTIAACVLFNERITADVVFSMAQYFNVLQLTAAILYPLALSLGAEALISITRIEEYLLMEEKDEHSDIKHNRSQSSETRKKSLNDVAIDLSNISASWNSENRKTLHEINIQIKPGLLYGVVGTVGAGKSSLLQLLLGELPVSSGKIEINGTISYASQEPWLFSGKVRNNILFGLPYDRHRYQQVVKCCALQTDFDQLPNGDQTIVGERGASLSGGQRARISLARSVYKSANIYLLDDPLSAVDSHVGNHLFEEVIGPQGFLAQRHATRILVTHQIHFLKDADYIIIIDKGQIIRRGTFKELASDDSMERLLEETPESTADNEYIDRMSVIYEEDDIPYMDGVAGGYLRMKKSISSSDQFTSKSISLINIDEQSEEQAKGTISLNVWTRYFLAGGSVFSLVVLVVVLFMSQIVTSGSDYFVNFWTQQEFLRFTGHVTSLTTTQCVTIYGLLILGVIFACLLRGFLFFNICMRSSKNLHNQMFSSLLSAPMRFFDTNPSGRILNRFSKDMGAIDELLPRSMMEAIQITLVMIGILIMVSIVNPLMIGTLCFAIVLFALLLKLFIRPGQDLKRLEGICRSPIFSQLSATLNGITTIRSRDVQNKLAAEFDSLQDTHSSVWQLSISANTALGLWLDLISSMFVACVTFSFVFIYTDAFSGNMGLAISQSLILTGMVQYGVRQSTDAMQHMTSVERILQYTDLESEISPHKIPDKEWPDRGHVQFKGMSLRYDQNDTPVLYNLKVNIEPGWKVGIVGRTGAGKSSLIGALFRLAIIEGEILIDDIDTGTIALESLRSKVSIIPQDPVLFSATVRYNLDPFNLYSDDVLWKSLEAVELKQSIESLDFQITEGGSNFSIGERQLICLARAILRNNKVLVLDEATANVDPKTDNLIQRTIREQFKMCTVLTVAHRLHTIMDSDRVMVMDGGSAKEFDYPYILLQNSNGIFRSMVDAVGSPESDSLWHIAEQTYNQTIGKTVYATD